MAITGLVGAVLLAFWGLVRCAALERALVSVAQQVVSQHRRLCALEDRADTRKP